MISTFFFTPGLMALLIFMINAFKSHLPIIYKFVIFYSLLIIAIASCVQSHKMSFPLLECNIFCWGNASIIDGPQTIPYNYSAKYTFGMLYFFTSVIFTVLITGQLLVLHVQAYYKGDLLLKTDQQEFTRKSFITNEHKRRTITNTVNENPSLTNSRNDEMKEAFTGRTTKKCAPIDDKRKNISYYVLMILVFGLLFPFIIFSCMALPTWWAYFTPYDIQKYRSILPPQYVTKVYTGYDDGYDDNNVNVVKKANSFAWLNLSKNPIYQEYVFLFPDIVMYYGLIYLVVMIALLSEFFPQLRQQLLKRHLPYKLCLGESLIASFFVLFLSSYYPYWFLDHVWEQGYISPVVIPVEDAARSMGQTANVVCGLLILPVSRNSIWSLVFGVSYESLIVYHKCIAAVFFVVVTLHMFLVWRVYYMNHTWPKDVLSVPTKYHSTDFTIPSVSVSYFIMIICMGVCALEINRRRHHELFWFAHRFATILFLIVLWHATMAWYYVLIGLILYTVDHVIRFSRVVGTSVIIEQATVLEASDSSVTCLTYRANETLVSAYGKKAPLKYQMGQYFFVNIPEISILEWHPFSISSCPSDLMITHHIKNMGENQWTGRLANTVKRIEKLDSKKALRRIVMNIDGPYGSPLRASQYDAILFVSGGIGITPVHSCFRQIYKTLTENPSAYPSLLTVRLLWVTRKNDKYLDHTWTMILSDNIINKEGKQLFSVAKYLTGMTKEIASESEQGFSPIHDKSAINSTNERSSNFSATNSINERSSNFYEQTEVYYGRPPFEKEVREFSEGHKNNLVWCCGPKQMIEAVHDVCIKMPANIEFREDLFAL